MLEREGGIKRHTIMGLPPAVTVAAAAFGKGEPRQGQ